MKSFEEIWAVTDAIPGSFTHLSGEMLYKAATTLQFSEDFPENFVEVGVDQGRSASILLFAARARFAKVTLIDSWESILIDNYVKVELLAAKIGGNVDIWCKSSAEAAAEFKEPIDLIHIDANHYAPNPDNDCALWLPKVRSGGIACFHDYDSTFVAVKPAVDKHTEGWEDLGVFDGLAIRRKP